MTKTEFGIDLYEVIKTCGAILLLREHIAASIHQGKGYAVQDLKKRHEEESARLRQQFPRLSNVDQAAMLERYSWIGAM